MDARVREAARRFIPPQLLRACAHCKRTVISQDYEPFETCQDCHSAVYCTGERACLRKDAARHRKECLKLEPEARVVFLLDGEQKTRANMQAVLDAAATKLPPDRLAAAQRSFEWLLLVLEAHCGATVLQAFAGADAHDPPVGVKSWAADMKRALEEADALYATMAMQLAHARLLFDYTLNKEALDLENDYVRTTMITEEQRMEWYVRTIHQPRITAYLELNREAIQRAAHHFYDSGEAQWRINKNKFARVEQDEFAVDRLIANFQFKPHPARVTAWWGELHTMLGAMPLDWPLFFDVPEDATSDVEFALLFYVRHLLRFASWSYTLMTRVVGHFISAKEWCDQIGLSALLVAPARFLVALEEKTTAAANTVGDVVMEVAPAAAVAMQAIITVRDLAVDVFKTVKHYERAQQTFVSVKEYSVEPVTGAWSEQREMQIANTVHAPVGSDPTHPTGFDLSNPLNTTHICYFEKYENRAMCMIQATGDILGATQSRQMYDEAIRAGQETRMDLQPGDTSYDRRNPVLWHTRLVYNQMIQCVANALVGTLAKFTIDLVLVNEEELQAEYRRYHAELVRAQDAAIIRHDLPVEHLTVPRLTWGQRLQRRLAIVFNRAELGEVDEICTLLGIVSDEIAKKLGYFETTRVYNSRRRKAAFFGSVAVAGVAAGAMLSMGQKLTSVALASTFCFPMGVALTQAMFYYSLPTFRTTIHDVAFVGTALATDKDLLEMLRLALVDNGEQTMKAVREFMDKREKAGIIGATIDVMGGSIMGITLGNVVLVGAPLALALWGLQQKWETSTWRNVSTVGTLLSCYYYYHVWSLGSYTMAAFLAVPLAYLGMGVTAGMAVMATYQICASVSDDTSTKIAGFCDYFVSASMREGMMDFFRWVRGWGWEGIKYGFLAYRLYSLVVLPVFGVFRGFTSGIINSIRSVPLPLPLRVITDGKEDVLVAPPSMPDQKQKQQSKSVPLPRLVKKDAAWQEAAAHDMRTARNLSKTIEDVCHELSKGMAPNVLRVPDVRIVSNLMQRFEDACFVYVDALIVDWLMDEGQRDTHPLADAAAACSLACQALQTYLDPASDSLAVHKAWAEEESVLWCARVFPDMPHFNVDTMPLNGLFGLLPIAIKVFPVVVGGAGLLAQNIPYQKELLAGYLAITAVSVGVALWNGTGIDSGLQSYVQHGISAIGAYIRTPRSTSPTVSANVLHDDLSLIHEILSRIPLGEDTPEKMKNDKSYKELLIEAITELRDRLTLLQQHEMLKLNQFGQGNGRTFQSLLVGLESLPPGTLQNLKAKNGTTNEFSEAKFWVDLAATLKNVTRAPNDTEPMWDAETLERIAGKALRESPSEAPTWTPPEPSGFNWMRRAVRQSTPLAWRAFVKTQLAAIENMPEAMQEEAFDLYITQMAAVMNQQHTAELLRWITRYRVNVPEWTLMEQSPARLRASWRARMRHLLSGRKTKALTLLIVPTLLNFVYTRDLTILSTFAFNNTLVIGLETTARVAEIISAQRPDATAPTGQFIMNTWAHATDNWSKAAWLARTGGFFYATQIALGQAYLRGAPAAGASAFSTGIWCVTTAACIVPVISAAITWARMDPVTRGRAHIMDTPDHVSDLWNATAPMAVSLGIGVAAVYGANVPWDVQSVQTLCSLAEWHCPRNGTLRFFLKLVPLLYVGGKAAAGLPLTEPGTLPLGNRKDEEDAINLQGMQRLSYMMTVSLPRAIHDSYMPTAEALFGPQQLHTNGDIDVAMQALYDATRDAGVTWAQTKAFMHALYLSSKTTTM
jgi:hypothetical protein